jgi:hypothetical protein
MIFIIIIKKACMQTFLNNFYSYDLLVYTIIVHIINKYIYICI